MSGMATQSSTQICGGGGTSSSTSSSTSSDSRGGDSWEVISNAGDCWHGSANKAIDGNSSDSSCSCTKKECRPWWRLQLSSVYKVAEIEVTNREINPERLIGTEILIGNSEKIHHNFRWNSQPTWLSMPSIHYWLQDIVMPLFHFGIQITQMLRSRCVHFIGQITIPVCKLRIASHWEIIQFFMYFSPPFI